MTKTNYLKQVQESVAKARAPKGFPVKLIGIDGHGGSGKSTFAEFLAKDLKAEIIHQDDFASWDIGLNWWPRLIKDILEPIQKGAKSLSYERGKWWPNHNPEPVRKQPVTTIMILEGVSSTRKEFRPYLTYKIWIETPRNICLKRGIERDKDQGSSEEIIKKWEDYLKEEDEYIARDNPIENADLVVDGTENIHG